MKSWIPEVVLLTLESIVLVGFYLVHSHSEQEAPTSVGLLVSAVSAMIFLLVIYSALRLRLTVTKLHDVAHEVSGTRQRMEETASLLIRRTTSLVVYRQDEFFKEFGAALDRARHGVALSHFDSRSPLATATPAADAYYQKLSECVRRKPEVSFRRLERRTRDKVDWLLKLRDDYSGARNFSVALLPFGGRQRNKLPVISVQIIDEEVSFLVAVASHEDLHSARDMALMGAEAARIWQAYYDELWNDSDLLIDKGAVNDELLRALELESEGSGG